MKTRTLIVAALLLVGGPAFAQNILEHTILRDYNLNSTTLIYACLGNPSTPTGNFKSIAGGSATKTIVGGSLGGIAVGDEITVTVAGVEERTTVLTKPSSTTITTNDTFDWSGNGTAGYPYQLRKFTSGTADTLCWVNTADYPQAQIVAVEYNQGDLTGGVSFRVEGKTASPGALPQRIYPSSSTDCTGVTMTYSAGYCNLPTANAGVDDRVSIVNAWPFAFIRVGLIIPTADPSDAGANVEKVSVFIRGWNPR